MYVHDRRSLRLDGYDYAQAGAYFVTICTHQREFLFGDIIEGEMQLNGNGREVQALWNELPNRFAHLELDAFVVMPNHVHGIATFVGAGLALPGPWSNANRIFRYPMYLHAAFAPSERLG